LPEVIERYKKGKRKTVLCQKAKKEEENRALPDLADLSIILI